MLFKFCTSGLFASMISSFQSLLKIYTARNNTGFVRPGHIYAIKPAWPFVKNLVHI